MRAVTRQLTDAVDLNDVARGDGYLFVRDGVGIAGRGVAATVAPHDAFELLGSIEHDAPPGTPGPVALGCLAFIPGAASELVVPAVLVTKTDAGATFLTTIDGASAELSAPRPTPAAATFRVEPGVSVDTYLTAVTKGRDAVRRGDLTKVVIARDVLVTSDWPIDIHAVLLRLRAVFGSSYRYAIDGFVGASPELLVEVRGNEIRSHPLAGTTGRTGDPDTDRRLAEELLASTKNQIEHRVVIDMVHDTLLPWCSYLDEEAEPSVMAVANVQHLATAMSGHLSSPKPHVLTLARALSPTPALGGYPRHAALELIGSVEGFERGNYGGAVGWMDANGDGTWAVAIRCAEIRGRTARLFAGGGIVADSDPHAELAETQTKFQAMLGAIIRP
jgi:menaquinone-specific isochorismate synthase